MVVKSPDAIVVKYAETLTSAGIMAMASYEKTKL